MFGDIQSCVIATERFSNEVHFHKLLGLLGAKMKLESLA